MNISKLTPQGKYTEVDQGISVSEIQKIDLSESDVSYEIHAKPLITRNIENPLVDTQRLKEEFTQALSVEKNPAKVLELARSILKTEAKVDEKIEIFKNDIFPHCETGLINAVLAIELFNEIQNRQEKEKFFKDYLFYLSRWGFLSLAHLCMCFESLQLKDKKVFLEVLRPSNLFNLTYEDIVSQYIVKGLDESNWQYLEETIDDAFIQKLIIENYLTALPATYLRFLNINSKENAVLKYLLVDAMQQAEAYYWGNAMYVDSVDQQVLELSKRASLIATSLEVYTPFHFVVPLASLIIDEDKILAYLLSFCICFLKTINKDLMNLLGKGKYDLISLCLSLGAQLEFAHFYRVETLMQDKDSVVKNFGKTYSIGVFSWGKMGGIAPEFDNFNWVYDEARQYLLQVKEFMASDAGLQHISIQVDEFLNKTPLLETLVRKNTIPNL